MSRQRQQWGCGTFVALALVLGAVITYWYIAVPVLVVLIVGAIAIGSAKQRGQPPRRAISPQQPRVSTGLSPAQEAERQELYRRLDAISAELSRRQYRTRCDHCGAPRQHGEESCRYCGRSLVVG